jgi:Leucine-rich repeat (LRR) protein
MAIIINKINNVITTNVNLGYKKLSSLPDSTDGLGILYNCDNDYDLNNLPKLISELVNLNELSLYNNEFSNLPESITKFVNLEKLFLHHNKLSSLPESIGTLVKLETLTLDSNQLSSLPESICKLVNLKSLILHNNRLTVLPESIDKLINLQLLNLSNNNLVNLPESIGRLSKLRELNLNYNQLKIIPTSILNIKESLHIDVFSYEIDNLNPDTEILIFSQLYEELTNLPINLKEIWIHIANNAFNHKLPFGCVVKYYTGSFL